MSPRVKQGVSGPRVIAIPTEGQVSPFGVHRFDQRHLLAPPPALEFFLPRDSTTNIGGRIVVHQLGNVVLAREAPRVSLFMLEHPAFQVIGHANVKGPGTAGRYVNVVLAYQLVLCPLSFLVAPLLGMTVGEGARLQTRADH